MATAKKLPSGSWRCQVYSHTEIIMDKEGKPRKKRIYESFTSDDPSPAGKREAEFAAAEFAMKKDLLSKNKNTFKYAAENYINMREKVLSPNSIKEYRRLLNRDLLPLHEVEIRKVTQDTIQNFINQYAPDMSPKSVYCTHGFISAVLKQANPNLVLNTTLPKKVRPKLHTPTDADIDKLLSVVSDSEIEIAILLAAYGPMRRGEICALDSNHIDGNTVHVEFNMVKDLKGNWILKSPKSYAGNRYIQFPDFVTDKIKNRTGRILTINPDQLSDRFRRLVKRLDLPAFRFHDLRHYGASILHALGMQDQYILQRGGWETDITLKQVYRHTLEDQEKLMNDKANEHFSKQHATRNATQKK